MRLRLVIAMGVSVALAGGGTARADSSLPDATDDNPAEVSSLPERGELKLALAFSKYDGCSMSYHSDLEEVAVSLTLDGAGRATLEANGTHRTVAGGRASVSEAPRAYRDERGHLGARWAGTAKRTGEAIKLALSDGAGRPLRLTCRVERVARDGVKEARTVGALVCRPDGEGMKALPLGMAEQLAALAFGRGPGYRTAERAHRYSNAGPRPPHVELVRR